MYIEMRGLQACFISNHDQCVNFTTLPPLLVHLNHFLCRQHYFSENLNPGRKYRFGVRWGRARTGSSRQCLHGSVGRALDRGLVGYRSAVGKVETLLGSRYM